MATIKHARRLGAGAILQALNGDRYKVSDWSPVTGGVWGYTFSPEGLSGEYGRLPDNLMPPEGEDA